MPRVKRSCVPCFAWQSMTLGPAKHEKEARTGRISNVLRISGARSAEKSVASRENKGQKVMRAMLCMGKHDIGTRKR